MMREGEALEGRILEELSSRRLLSPDGTTTVFGMPAVRRVPEGGGPEALAEARPRQKQLVELSYATPWTGTNSCAAWIERAWSRMGLGLVAGDAFELCRAWCTKTELSALKVGMAVGVERHPYGADGLTYGHVGLYIGDSMVRDSSDRGVRTVPLSAWLSVYGVMEDPRWGWLAGIALDRA